MASISDSDCVSFLQTNLPRLHLRWAGFRRVRHQVRKRLQRRLDELGITDLSSYCRFLQAHTSEWQQLEHCCRITISRFYRDRVIFEILRHEVLPLLAEETGDVFRLWCAGCASGEEAYSLALIWHFEQASHFPRLQWQIIASDSNPAMLARAKRACYPTGALKELPLGWRETAFREQSARDLGNNHGSARENGTASWELLPCYRQGVRFVAHDLRTEPLAGPFLVICCRNLVFTYFDIPLQQQVLQQLESVLAPEGVLVIGSHEKLPDNELLPWPNARGIYRKRGLRGHLGIK